MDAMNRRQSLTWTRSLGAALGLALALGLAACAAPNAGDDSDKALFARLGLKPLSGEEPLRAQRATEREPAE